MRENQERKKNLANEKAVLLGPQANGPTMEKRRASFYDISGDLPDLSKRRLSTGYVMPCWYWKSDQ
ncbi:MAG: hypothetical protein PUF97_00260 [Bifidobacteriaceae bacterium]|nr:hypothetical protein [Bifidobacteriaceae bacterium]